MKKRGAKVDPKKNDKKIINEKAILLETALIEWEFFKNYSSKAIYGMFVLIFVSNILVNVDHGSLPGCSVQIKQDLRMSDLQFGVLGSIVFAGMGSGASAAAWLYEKSAWVKYTLAITLLLNGATLITMTLTNSFYFNVFVRFWIGFFQVFQSIYMPVWADTFAAEK